jgi:hypothetical protein
MVDRDDKSSNMDNRRLTLIFHFSWITVIVVFTVMMRILIGPPEILEELDELETIDSEKVTLDRKIPATLKPMSEPLSEGLKAKSIYLPFYRTLYVGENRVVKKLPATLSVHNTSLEHPVILRKLTYYDRNGKVITERLDKPHLLSPMASAEFYIDPEQLGSDIIASTIVDWSSEENISPPLIEAIVVGKYGTKGFSVLIRGVDLPK